MRDAEIDNLTLLVREATHLPPECGVKVGRLLHSSEAKLARVPKEAYLKSHPRNTLSSAASERFLQRNRRTAAHGNVRSVFGPRLVRTTNEAVAAPVAPS